MNFSTILISFVVIEDTFTGGICGNNRNGLEITETLLTQAW